MAEPKRTRIDLKLVDENFTIPADFERLPPAEQRSTRDRALVASGIKEGKRRALDGLGDTIAKATTASANTLTDAHAKELDRTAKVIAKGAHRDGLLQGIVSGMALAVALAFSTWIILREVVITNVATQRVGHNLEQGPVPDITEPQGTGDYERGRREPGDASN